MEDHVLEIAGLDSRSGLIMGESHEKDNVGQGSTNAKPNHNPP
jgi:hypothetical protein